MTDRRCFNCIHIGVCRFYHTHNEEDLAEICCYFRDPESQKLPTRENIQEPKPSTLGGPEPKNPVPANWPEFPDPKDQLKED